jgi:hypothetical protein
MVGHNHQFECWRYQQQLPAIADAREKVQRHTVADPPQAAIAIAVIERNLGLRRLLDPAGRDYLPALPFAFLQIKLADLGQIARPHG